MLEWERKMSEKGTWTILWPSPFKRWFILWNLLKKKIYKGKAVTNLTTWYSLCTFVGNIWFVVISDVLNSRILLVDARGIFFCPDISRLRNFLFLNEILYPSFGRITNFAFLFDAKIQPFGTLINVFVTLLLLFSDIVLKEIAFCFCKIFELYWLIMSILSINSFENNQ